MPQRLRAFDVAHQVKIRIIPVGLNEVRTGLHQQRVTGFQFHIADLRRQTLAVAVNRHDGRVVVRAELSFAHRLPDQRR